MSRISILQPDTYLKGWHICNLMSKPTVQLLIEYIEQNPGCSTKAICEQSLFPHRTRISQLLGQLYRHEILIVKPVGTSNSIRLNHAKIELINSSIETLL